MLSVKNPAGSHRRNPINVYPDNIPPPLGFLLSATAIGVLIAGVFIAMCVLAGAA